MPTKRVKKNHTSNKKQKKKREEQSSLIVEEEDEDNHISPASNCLHSSSNDIKNANLNHHHRQPSSTNETSHSAFENNNTKNKNVLSLVSSSYSSTKTTSVIARQQVRTSSPLSSLVTFLLGVLVSSIYFCFTAPPQPISVYDDYICSSSISTTTPARTKDMQRSNISSSNAQRRSSISETKSHADEENETEPVESKDQATRPQTKPNSKSTPTCNLYLAKSTIHNAGLGMYTTKAIPSQQPVGIPEIVIQLPDLNPNYYSSIKVLSYDYLWDGQNTGGQYEGRNVYSVIPGTGMIANGHLDEYNTIQSSSRGSIVDNGGLYRKTHPAAGSSSSYFNYTFVARRDIPAGGEILVQYGFEWFNERIEKEMIPASSSASSSPSQRQESNSIGDKMNKDNNNNQYHHGRSLAWLEENGSCLDNLQMKQSTNPHAGRGAFASRYIPKGAVVAPAPVIQITDRQSMSMFKVKTDPVRGDVVERSEQLLLNYCFGHVNSSILLYPIAPIVNYINHDSNKSNVKLRWSTSTQHEIQDPKNMTIEDVKQMKHAGLMLEFVATKDIAMGDEIFLNYGPDWERAWHDHVHKWKPIDSDKENAMVYANIFDKMTKVIQTIREQQASPYPNDFFTSCYYKYHSSKSSLQSDIMWNETKTTLHDSFLRPCMILDRVEGKEKQFYYTVGIQNRFGLSEQQRIPQGKPHIVHYVPRHAIKFSTKLYTTDQHLEHAFRHEINVPESIYPDGWLDLQ